MIAGRPVDPPSATRSWLAAFAAALTILAAAGIALSTVRMVIACAVPMPILDQWAQLVGNRRITLAWLFSQHNEHRLFFPRLVFVADRWLASETGSLSLAVSLVLQACLIVLLLRLGRGAGIRGRWALVVASSLVVALLAWSAQYENYTWPFQVQFFGVVAAAAACFAAVAVLRPTAVVAALAISLGGVATFTLSSGIVAPFLAAALAAWLRRPLAYVAAFWIAAAALLGLYLAGYHTPPEHADPLQSIAKPAALFGYVAAVLGGPVANALGTLSGQICPLTAQFAGSGGVLLLVLLAAPLLRHRSATAPEAAALLALCGFVIAMALLTALGRLRFGLPSALVSRYATPALAFWACILLLGMAHLQARPLPLRRLLAGGMAAVLLILIALTQPRFAAVARVAAADRMIALPALVAGVADRVLIAPIYETPAVPLHMRLTEFASRTGPFSQRWAPWIGTMLRDHVALTAAARCDGRYDTATPIADPLNPGWRMQGELLRPSIKLGLQVVALTDPAGVIRGYGISDAGATTLTAAGPAGEPPRDGWVGALADAQPAQVQAYVLLDHDRSACPLRNEPVLEMALQVAIDGPAPQDAPPGGSVDAVSIKQNVTADGWALTQRAAGTPQIHIDTNLLVRSASVTAVLRPDTAAAFNDPRLAKAGFRVLLLLQPGRPLPTKPHFCLWSEDAVYGRHVLIMNPASDAQRRLCTR